MLNILGQEECSAADAVAAVPFYYGLWVGLKTVNRVTLAFLVPLVLSIFFIFSGILTAGQLDDTSGIMGLRLSTLQDNCNSKYQFTINTMKGGVFCMYVCMYVIAMMVLCGIQAPSLLFAIFVSMTTTLS